MSNKHSAQASDQMQKISFDEFKANVISDYRIGMESRQASLLGRKEVLTGKAKFGIFGDGKEVAQLAMARSFQNGDFRSGYYRDQTFMFATGMSNIKEFFAQLYAFPDVDADPCSAGRSMNGHFGTRSIDEDGAWKNLMEMKNSSADISPTASGRVELNTSYSKQGYILALDNTGNLFEKEHNLRNYLNKVNFFAIFFLRFQK